MVKAQEGCTHVTRREVAVWREQSSFLAASTPLGPCEIMWTLVQELPVPRFRTGNERAVIARSRMEHMLAEVLCDPLRNAIVRLG